MTTGKIMFIDKDLNSFDERTLTETNVRFHIKKKFGDRYLEFLNDLTNINFTAQELTKKWGPTHHTLKTWNKLLGYRRSFNMKLQMRLAYRADRRAKHRQETGKLMIALLQKRNKAT
jgi:hypothetical protein